MIVKVIITRRFQPGRESEVFELIRKMRSTAINQSGYIMGESLINTEDPQEFIVISTWQSMDDWNNWKKSEERKAVDDQLTELQERQTQYKICAFSKYRVYVQKGFPEPLD